MARPLRKRLSFQLTPLLDLLLIVIFAQFMDVQRNSVSLNAQASAERNAVEARARELEIRHRERSDRLTQELNQRVDLLNQRQRRTNQQLADTFDIPRQLIDEVARLRETGQAREAQRIEAASSRVQQLLRARGNELSQLLVRVDEMQKHVTFWEAHLMANGRVQLSDGQQIRTISFVDESEFILRTFQASKSLPEPRTLVLILLTYGDTQARFRRDAVAGMPRLTEQLRRDAGNTRWYDYSLLGFRPDGPVLSAAPQNESGSQ